MTARLLVGLVRVYQVVLSPLLGDRCKYHPTCSQYAIDALHEHGAARGHGPRGAGACCAATRGAPAASTTRATRRSSAALHAGRHA